MSHITPEPARIALAFLVIALATSPLTTWRASAEEPEVWPGIREEVFGARDIAENDGAVMLFTPDQAEDAALVPVSVRIPASIAREAAAMTLVIDRNPAPIAATFKFGDAFRNGPDVGERMLETRIRVDSFSKVRAILETSDGKLHMSAKFVIGAGGCSAPSSKDAEAALANLGKLQINSKISKPHGEAWREVQVMIKHPNFTGLQMDPDTRGYVPARFVNDLQVSSAGVPLLRMEGGISISENPHLRFTYGVGKDEIIDVRARDTQGAEFSGRSPASGT